MADDRWAFTSRSSALNYGSIAALAAASRALAGYNDDLARECRQVATAAWAEEQGQEPFRFSHGNTTGGPLELEQYKAAAELLLSTGETTYRRALEGMDAALQQYFRELVPYAVRALPHMAPAFAVRLEGYAREYVAAQVAQERDNPYGVEITAGGWAGNGTIIANAISDYYLHRAFPALVDREQVLRALNYLYGTHPDSNLSFVSGVGARSKKVAYGMNRADFSFIAGGVVPGVLILKPDFPENKEDWPFLWGENEYVISVGASYLFLVNAAARILAAVADDGGDL